MIYGNYDDRNDARASVKGWLRHNEPSAYTPEQIRKLVVDSVMADRDPVDPIADSMREGSYGALLGLVEFAEEEMQRLLPGSIWAITGPGSEPIPHLWKSRDRDSVEAAISRVKTMRSLLADISNAGRKTDRADRALMLAEDIMRASIAQTANLAHAHEAA